MTIALQNKISLQQFLSLPETKPANEYVDGQIYQKIMPKGKHSIIQRELTMAIDRAVASKNSASVFPELRCNFGGRSIVPDISVFITERIPRDPDGTVANDFNISPDWTIEILSPEQSHAKVVKNIVHCLKHGGSIGWLIDPSDRSILAYHANGLVEIFDELEPQILLPVPVFAQELQLSLDVLFGWLTK